MRRVLHGHIIFDVEIFGAYNDRRGGCINM